MKKTKILTLTVLTVLLTMPLMASSASATTIPPFTLSNSSGQLPFVLPAGTTFNGSISSTGTIRFWVNAPNGSQIVNLGLIDKTASFGFVAQQNGNYTLNFENDLSNTVQVTFSYTTNPDISVGNHSTGTPLSNILLISIIITVVGSILIFVVLRRKSRKEIRNAVKS